jgi:hypothetical protein
MNIAKGSALALVLATTASSGLTQQDKPRVYISGSGNVDVRTNGNAVGGRHWASGSSHSTIGAHDQTMELAKDFNKQCPEVTVSLNATMADYTVGMNHEAFHGVIHKNDQVMVTNRLGDLVFSNATRAVSHSVNDSCSAILADWKSHGQLEIPVSAHPSKALAGSDAEKQAKEVSKAVPQTNTSPTTVAPDSMQVASSDQPESLGEIARRNRAKKEAQQQSAQSQQTSQPPNK